MHSTPAYDALMRLRAAGSFRSDQSKFSWTATGCKIEQSNRHNGNIHINQCPHCDKDFDMQYIINAKGIPLCDRCKVAIRPGIRLLGERVESNLMTQAAVACEAADVLLILGKNMYNDRLEYSAAPEHEQIKVLFSKSEFEQNSKVNFIIRDDICKFLPLIIN